MKPVLKDIYPDLFGILATPKSEELVATPIGMAARMRQSHFS